MSKVHSAQYGISSNRIQEIIGKVLDAAIIIPPSKSESRAYLLNTVATAPVLYRVDLDFFGLFPFNPESTSGW